MRWRRLFISIGLVCGFLVLVLLGLVAMVKREPGFYTQSEMPPGERRTEQSERAVAKWFQISSALSEPQWDLTFSADEINAFFQEHYFNFGGDDNLPDGWHEPRVKIEDGKMRFGVRYGSGPFSTVLSLEFKLWKVKDEVNTLAMEIVSFQAGSLPISTGNLLDRISEAARRDNIDIAWYRKDGHPVAIMRFQADLTRPTFQFDQIELKNGELRIAGTATDLMTPPPPRVVPKP